MPRTSGGAQGSPGGFQGSPQLTGLLALFPTRNMRMLDRTSASLLALFLHLPPIDVEKITYPYTSYNLLAHPTTRYPHMPASRSLSAYPMYPYLPVACLSKI